MLLLIAILARVLTFGNPIVHVDEQFYFVVASKMWHGALPFVHVWDRKPIGLFLLYMPAAAFGVPVGIWVYQAMALACVVATAALVARLAERAGFTRGALLAGCLYILWLNFAEGEGGQSPVFYNLLMAGAASLIAPGADNRWRRGLGAMALVGIAFQIKYSVLFEGSFFGLWWMLHQARAEGWPKAMARAVPMVLLAILPTALAFGIYQAIGQGAAFAYANFGSILERTSPPASELFGNAATVVVILAPLVAMVWASRRQPAGDGEIAVRRFLHYWLGAALFGLAIFGSWFDHYALPAMVPACAAAGGFLGRQGRERSRVVVAIVAAAALGGQVMLLAKRTGRGTQTSFGRVAEAVGQGPGCLYVYSGDVMLYATSGRCTLTSYLFPSHLGRVREAGAIGVDQEAEVRRILSEKPAVLVMRKAYRGERPEIRALVAAEAARNYRLKVTLPEGNERISVFERSAP